jgi:hypothetical protein
VSPFNDLTLCNYCNFCKANKNRNWGHESRVQQFRILVAIEEDPLHRQEGTASPDPFIIHTQMKLSSQSPEVRYPTSALEQNKLHLNFFLKR